MKKIAYILFFTTIFLFSCSKKQEPEYKIIPKDTMAMILADIHIADATLSHIKNIPPGQNDKYYLYIFKKYNTNKTVFDSSISYYTTHGKEYEKIYEDVMFRLNKLEGEIMAEKDSSRNDKLLKFKKVLSLNSNFENLKDNFLSAPISKIKSKSGKNAVLFDYKKKKSKDVIYKIQQEISAFKIKFHCSISMLSNKTKTYPMLVVSIEDNDGHVNFRKEISFRSYISNKQEWNKINIESTYTLPSEIDSGVIKIFIANPYKNDFFLDDYFLELFVK